MGRELCVLRKGELSGAHGVRPTTRFFLFWPIHTRYYFDDCGLYLRLMAVGRSDTFIGRDSPSAICTSAMPGALNGAYTYRYYATRYPV